MATIVTRAGKGSDLTHNEMDSNFINLNSASIPVGLSTIWWTSTLPNSTWLELNGASLSTSTYSELFALIGYTFGGSGANFNLPDTRGYFIRGWDHGAGNDPDAATRTNRGDGTTGDNIGTKQADQLKSHQHLYLSPGTPGAISQPTGSANNFGNNNTQATGGNETRPKNINAMFIIKAKSN